MTCRKAETLQNEGHHIIVHSQCTADEPIHDQQYSSVKQNVPNTQVWTTEDMHDRRVPGQKLALYQTGVADFQLSHHNLTVMCKLKRPPQTHHSSHLLQPVDLSTAALNHLAKTDC